MTITEPSTHAPASTTSWSRACAVAELEPFWGEAVLLRGHQIAVFKLSESEVYAVSHEDPATGAPVIARGIVGSRGERPTVASPLNKQVYDLSTGACLTEPSLALRAFRTRTIDGIIEIELGDA